MSVFIGFTQVQHILRILNKNTKVHCNYQQLKGVKMFK